MKKILLLIEDYTDQSAFEYLFKRIGFDCSSVSRDALLGESLLTFIPDLVIVGSQGRNVDYRKVEPRLSRLQPKPKMAFIQRRPDGTQVKGPYIAPTGSLMEFYDGAIELPVDTRSFVKFVCKILEVDQSSFIDKFEKLEQAQKLEGNDVLSTFKAETKEVPREKKYDLFLKSHPTPEDASIMSGALARKAMQELAIDSEPEKVSLEQLEEERRNFVRELYKKGRS